MSDNDNSLSFDISIKDENVSKQLKSYEAEIKKIGKLTESLSSSQKILTNSKLQQKLDEQNAINKQKLAYANSVREEKHAFTQAQKAEKDELKGFELQRRLAAQVVLNKQRLEYASTMREEKYQFAMEKYAERRIEREANEKIKANIRVAKEEEKLKIKEHKASIKREKALKKKRIKMAKSISSLALKAGVGVLGSAAGITALAGQTIKRGAKLSQKGRLHDIDPERVQSRSNTYSGYGGIDKEEIEDKIVGIQKMINLSKMGDPSKLASFRMLDMQEGDDAVDLLDKLHAKLQNFDSMQVRRLSSSLGIDGDFLQTLKASDKELSKFAGNVHLLSNVDAKSLDNLNQSWTLMKGNLVNIRNAITAGLTPALEGYIGRFNKWYSSNQDKIKEFGTDFASVILDLADIIGAVAGFLGKGIADVFKVAKMAVVFLYDQIVGLGKLINEYVIQPISKLASFTGFMFGGGKKSDKKSNEVFRESVPNMSESVSSALGRGKPATQKEKGISLNNVMTIVDKTTQGIGYSNIASMTPMIS